MSVFKAVLAKTGLRNIAIAASLIAGFEGLRNYVYDDGHGNLTVCYGYTHPSLKKGQKFTNEECIDLLIKETQQRNKQIHSLAKVDFRSEWQEAAFTSFVYHVGIGNYSTSTLLKEFNSGNHDKACDQLHRWVYVKKKDCRDKVNNCPGIPVRREKEWNWCMGNISPSEQFQYEKSVMNIYSEVLK